MQNLKRYPQSLLATACLPCRDDFSFDEAAFRRQIRLFAQGKVTRVYLFGTAGEGHAVSDSQYDRVVDTFLSEIDAIRTEDHVEIVPMVGLISLSTTTITEGIRRTRDKGVFEYQVSLSSWGEVDSEEMFAFFHTICDAFPDCRFLHFNLERAKRVATPMEYRRLCMEIPNLVATKNQTFDMRLIYELETCAPELTHFDGEAGFAYGCLVGRPGLILTILNANWGRALEYFRAGCEHDWPKLFEMHGEHMEAHRILFDTTGQTIRMDGAYDKFFVKLHDPLFSLRLLPPYQTHADRSYEAFVSALRERLPQWMPSETR